MNIIHGYSWAVYSYVLKITGWQEISVPVGAKPLSVQVRQGKPCIVMLCSNLRMETETRTIEMFKAGQCFGKLKRRYIGTFTITGGDMMTGDDLVYYVFIQKQRR